MNPLFIGTGNPGKIREFSSLLSPLRISALPVSSEKEIHEPSVEVSDGFLENAAVKALAYAKVSGGLTLAEDSGLSVAALNGLPGIFSARFYAVDPVTRTVRNEELNLPREEADRRNNERLLALLRDTPMPYRAAAFRVVVVVALGREVLFHAAEETHGWIAQHPAGTKGFGYDPIFIGQETFGKTYAEIDPWCKDRYSHRKRVTDMLVAWLARNRELLNP